MSQNYCPKVYSNKPKVHTWDLLRVLISHCFLSKNFEIYGSKLYFFHNKMNHQDIWETTTRHERNFVLFRNVWRTTCPHQGCCCIYLAIRSFITKQLHIELAFDIPVEYVNVCTCLIPYANVDLQEQDRTACLQWQLEFTFVLQNSGLFRQREVWVGRFTPCFNFQDPSTSKFCLCCILSSYL